MHVSVSQVLHPTAATVWSYGMEGFRVAMLESAVAKGWGTLKAL